MAAKSIGFISELVGNAQIRTESGMIKVALLGDIVKEGEVVTTGQDSRVVIDFNSGEKLSIGPQAQTTLDDSVSFDTGEFDVARVDQQAALQELLLEGLDVSVLEEPAAARTSQNADSNSLHDASVYERDGSEGEVETRLTPIDADTNTNQEPTFDTQPGENSSAQSASASQPTNPQPIDTSNITISLSTNITADDVINSTEQSGSIAISGSAISAKDCCLSRSQRLAKS